MKKIIKSFIPPFFLNIFVKITSMKYGWHGNYNSWEEAKKCSEGYDSEEILNKVKNSLLKVKKGQAAYERDSVIFDKVEYSWPVLSSLMMIAARKGGNLNIIDFGGSLGSTYFQNMKFLNELNNVKWNIVEQENFVKIGKEYFEDKNLRFFTSIKESLKESKSNVILLSSVIQYMEKPFELLDTIISREFDWILFDKTPFVVGRKEDRITIQKVSPAIYSASYPCWFFDKDKFLSFLSLKYDVVEEFECGDYSNINSKFLGFLLKKKC